MKCELVGFVNKMESGQGRFLDNFYKLTGEASGGDWYGEIKFPVSEQFFNHMRQEFPIGKNKLKITIETL